MGTLFAIRDLHIFYGSIHAVKGINLEIKEEGELVSLIGANGAGKTTIMHCISVSSGPDKARSSLRNMTC